MVAMEISLKKLVEVMDKLQDRKDLLWEDNGEGNYFNMNLDDEDLRTAEDLACGELITPDGQVNYAAVRWMKNHGYDVFPGERDSFGWLTGCIKKMGDFNAPVLVFG